MKAANLLFLPALFFMVSCNQQTRDVSKTEKLILRFDVDSNGNIANEKVKAQVLELGKQLQKSADKMMMTAYTEQSGSTEQNERIAWAMARAVRELMKTQGSRNATNVGVVIKGYQDPIDSLNPANIINRRIEIT